VVRSVLQSFQRGDHEKVKPPINSGSVVTRLLLNQRLNAMIRFELL
jgi:hypothetical protein